MAQLRVLGSKGHETAVWDRDKVQEGDPEAIAAVEEAESIVKEHADRGAAIFARFPGTEEHVQIGAFDPEADDIIVTLPIQGG